MPLLISPIRIRLSGQPFRLRRKNESLDLALFVMAAICFDHSKSLLRVTPKYLASSSRIIVFTQNCRVSSSSD